MPHRAIRIEKNLVVKAMRLTAGELILPLQKRHIVTRSSMSPLARPQTLSAHETAVPPTKNTSAHQNAASR
jgi:hypothetical protein